MKRDKVTLDIFWLKDKSLEDSDDLPDPDVLAQEIADDLQTALEQFTAIAEKVRADFVHQDDYAWSGMKHE